MPIIDGSVHYEMPAHIKALITPDFCSQFLKELHQIFGSSLEDSSMDYYVYQGGTAGWEAAFTNTCRKLNLHELCIYYSNLEWFDSDIFDGQLEDFLAEYKLVLDGFVSDEIARQNNLSCDDVRCCEHCGKYIHINDSVANEVDLGDGEPYVENICKTCATGDAVQELFVDIKRMVTEVLGKSKDNIFICEKCGKAHWTTHKGIQYCLHCEIEQVNANCNVYYRESLELNEKYKQKILNKK